MKSKIFPIIAILIFVGAAFWIVPILRNRYFNNSAEENGTGEAGTESTIFNNQNNSDEESPVQEPDLSQVDQDPEAEKDLEEEKKSLAEEKNVKESYLDVSKTDCDNQCEKYKNNLENLKYCQEVCGFTLQRNDVKEEECADEEGLDQDYCLRDLAISKKDFKICDKIEDKKISENCKNRITEDIIDAQLSE